MITIVSAGTPDFRGMMEENRIRCEALGYRYAPHGLSHSSDLVGAIPPATFKPRLMAEALREGEPRASFEPSATGDDPSRNIIGWMDADAIIVRPLDSLLDIDFDVAVTLREPDLIGTTQPTSNYLNSGVVFFRNTAAARLFVANWITLSDAMQTDQGALNLMVGPRWTDVDWKSSYGTTTVERGYRIHVLPCSEWNHCSWDRRPVDGCRVLHFKHGWRELRGPNWWRHELHQHLQHKRVIA